MDIAKQVTSLLNEAAVYNKQGLYEESMGKYRQAAELIKRHAHRIDHHKKHLDSIAGRLTQLNKKIQRMENESVAYQMPNIVLNVMKNNFSSSKDKDQAALEGALALAGFKQYESALEEFNKLLKSRSTRVEASKNIIRCHLAKGRTSKALDLFKHWQNSGLMGSEEMTELRLFFEALANEFKMDIELPDAETKKSAPPHMAKRPAVLKNRHIMDFSSLSVSVPNGRQKKQLREFKISSQSGDVVSLLISDHEKKVMEGLKKGTLLDPVQCFSSNAMFSGKAMVIENTHILSGDNAGHFSIDIRLQGI